jgi:hypothetical protein
MLAPFSALLLATTLVNQTVESLSRSADVVVHAKVRASTSKLAAPGLIVTVTELDVYTGIKGEPPATLKVVTRGGEVGELGQHVDGEATFRPGDETVLFLRRRESGVFTVVGHAQGAFHVKDLVVQQHPLDGAARPIAPLRLDALIARVRAAQ